MLDDESPVPAGGHASLHALYAHWRDCCRARLLPNSADLDIDRLIACDEGFALLAVESADDGRRGFRFLRVGTAHRRHTGRHLQGYTLQDLASPEVLPVIERAYAAVVDERRPHYWQRSTTFPGARPQTYERLLVPVADDGKMVNLIVGLWIWPETPASWPGNPDGRSQIA